MTRQVISNDVVIYDSENINELNYFYPLKFSQQSNTIRIKRATSRVQRRLRRRLRKRVRNLVRAGRFALARIVRRRLKASHGPP